MPINLYTYDETGRNFEEHELREVIDVTTKVVLNTTNRTSQAVIEDRLMKFIHNLGNDITVDVEINDHRRRTLDNFDF